MNRFDQTRLFFQMLCPVESETAAIAMSNLFDPNVNSMIDQGDETPIDMAVTYHAYIFSGGEKPYWFQPSE